MSHPPKPKEAPCPECGAMSFAVIPANAVLVEEAEDADGKVWVNCRSCDEQFLAHYREQPDDSDGEPTKPDSPQ